MNLDTVRAWAQIVGIVSGGFVVLLATEVDHTRALVATAVAVACAAFVNTTRTL